MTRKSFFAVIPAAGKSSRMDMGTSKQFLRLRGIPVLARTLLTFEGSPHIDGIIVACSVSEIPEVRELCSKYHITKLMAVAQGGETRQDSVRNALELLDEYIVPESAADSFVLIHDGARPFLSDHVLDNCFGAVVEWGACICAVPVKDTIKKASSDGFVDETIPRDTLWSVQTPQAFRFRDILAMHIKAAEEAGVFTDDASIAEHFGVKVKIVRGDYTNIKITTKDDLMFGEVIARNK